ncbi:MAG: sulfatase-like hydrolase/transferase [Dehalococcoidia bacterium]
MPQRPNILFIFTDQQRVDTMACYGNTQIQVPKLNELASQSFVVDNAYVSTPICTPARSTIMTGTWPHTNGCTANNVPLDESVQTIADHLPDEYLSAYYGKWHLGNDVIKQHGFKRWMSYEDNYRQYYTKDEYLSVFSPYKQYLIDQGYEPDGEAEGGTYFTRPMTARLPEEHTKANWIAERASEFIHTYANRPWALYINIFEPHPPYYGPYDDQYDPEDIPTPPTFLKKTPDNAAKLHSVLSGSGHADLESETSESGGEREWKELIARYWGLMTLTDNAVGKILKALEDSGNADNTIVVFTSEHGDQMGEHHLLGKGVFYEQSSRVPLLFRVPWLNEQEKHIPGRMSQIDLVPTILDLIGADIPAQLQGQSRKAVLEGVTDLDDNDVILEWHARSVDRHGGGVDVDTIQHERYRTLIGADGWKAVFTAKSQCELYNLNEDPYEQNNLFDDPVEQSRVKTMLDKVLAWQERTGDSAPMPSLK